MELEELNQWLQVILWVVLALASGLWATTFSLHSRGIWRGRANAWPSPSFWAKLPPRRSAMASVLLYACTIVCLYALFLSFRTAEPTDDRMQILDHPDITEAAKQYYDSGDVRAGLTGFLNANTRVFVESHKAAAARGQRDAWRRQLIEDGRDKVDVLLIMFPRIKDPTIQSDLLYCLHEITGIPLDPQPDLPVVAESIQTRFKKLQSQVKARKPPS